MAGHQPQPKECEFCGFETDQLHEVEAYGRVPGQGPFTPDDEKEWGWLCGVCWASPAGNAFSYPRHHANDTVALRTIAICTNMVLAKIASR